MFGGASAQNSLLNAMISSQFSQMLSPSLTTSSPTMVLPSSNLPQSLPANIQQQLAAASQFLLSSSADFLPQNPVSNQNPSLDFNSMAQQLAQQMQMDHIRPPPSYAEAIVDQVNWQQHHQQNALLSSLSNSMLAASATIQSPDILRLRQVTLKDEEELQQAVIAGLMGGTVREDCTQISNSSIEAREDVNVDENSETEEQKQEEEERRDEQPLDLSIRRNSKKKKALNRSFGEHPPPCTSATPSSPSPLCSNDFRNTVIYSGVLPQRNNCEVKRSASSVSHRANSTEPDVHEHFRRSLSGKWPRRTPNYAHPQPYYISPPTNNSSLASLSSAQSISNMLNSGTSFLNNSNNLQSSRQEMELGETAIEKLKLEGTKEEPTEGISSYLYWRKKSLSSSGSICNPTSGNTTSSSAVIHPKGMARKSFNGTSNRVNANRVETKIIINEGAKPVEDHFRKTFEMIKNGQLKSSENGLKSQSFSSSPLRHNHANPTSN